MAVLAFVICVGVANRPQSRSSGPPEEEFFDCLPLREAHGSIAVGYRQQKAKVSCDVGYVATTEALELLCLASVRPCNNTLQHKARAGVGRGWARNGRGPSGGAAVPALCSSFRPHGEWATEEELDLRRETFDDAVQAAVAALQAPGLPRPPGPALPSFEPMTRELCRPTSTTAAAATPTSEPEVAGGTPTSGNASDSGVGEPGELAGQPPTSTGVPSDERTPGLRIRMGSVGNGG